MRKKTIAAISMCSLMAATSILPLAGCGGGGGGSNGFTMWLSSGEKIGFYQNYNDNPILKYLLQKEWGEGENKTKLSFDITIPAAEGRKDDFGTRIATNNYTDIMDLSLSDYSIEQLYKQGVAMDLTDLVSEYMPNYKALIDSDPELTRSAYTIIDGQKKILYLNGIYKGTQPMYQGFMYRRDWVAKYGEMPSHIWGENKQAITYTTYAEAEAAGDWTGWVANPAYTAAGQKFTQDYGNDADNDYTDNVVFPSGANEPMYISDWEWMFSIFEKAWDALSLNKSEVYCYAPYYIGSDMNGDFAASFGGGGPYYYLDEDEGTVHFGMTESRSRAYVKCMNTWLKKGWLDGKFDQHSSDEFYKIETDKVYAGKIGAWRGSISALGTGIQSDKEAATQGAMVYGAKIPINDKYGDAENKWIEPDTIYQFSRVGSPAMISRTAKDKNLPALLSFFDYLYSEEGSVLKTFGLSKEEYEQTQDSFYTKHGLTDGAYYVTGEGDDKVYHYAENNPAGSDLAGAARLCRIPIGLELYENVDRGYTRVTQEAVDSWAYYKDTGNIMLDYMKKIPSDKMRTYSTTISALQDYIYVEFPKMILGTGGWNVDDDASWEKFCSEVNRKNPQRITNIFQDIYNLYNK